MAQDGTTAGGSSYTIDNVTFPVGRSKLQSIFDAIRSTNIGNTAPDLVAGQFWIDNNTPSTTVWTLYLYDGTDNISFATIDTVNNTVNFLDSTFDLINDTTPQLGGNLDLNSNDITGTGNINITGSLTSESIELDGAPNAFGTNTSNAYIFKTGSTGSAPFNQAGALLYQPRTTTTEGRSNHLFYTGSPLALRQNIHPNGDISFYEDTGTTAKFFWDASTERLGIGTTAPVRPLHISSGASTSLQLERTASGTEGKLILQSGTSFNAIYSRDGADSDKDFAIYTGSNERMRINSSGLGIGTTTPTRPLDIVTSNNLPIRTETSATQNYLQQTNSTGTTYIASTGDNFFIGTGSSGTERMRITSAGLMGIGTSSPTNPLMVQGSQGYASSASTLLTSTTKAAARIRGSNDASTSLWMGVETSNANPYLQVSNGTGTSSDPLLLQPFGGNVGIGVIPEAWNSNNTALQIGDAGALFASTNDSFVGLTANAYFDSINSRYEYINTDYATLYQQIDGTHIWSTAASGSADNAITFSETMRIDSSGNVMVGTTSSATTTAGVKLRSDNSIASVADGANSGYFGRLTSDGDVIKIRKDTTTVGVIGTQNWGIGTSSPAYPLTLYHSTAPYFALQNATTGTSATDGMLIGIGGVYAFIRNQENQPLVFQTNGNNERMRITSTGSVGVNTTSPDAKLEVRDDNNQNTTISASSQLQTAGNYHDFAVASNNTEYAVGIRRQVTQSSPSSLEPRMDFFVQNTNTYLPADRGVKMTLLNNGRLGIGTTSPTLPLEVSGSGLFGGSVIATGSTTTTASRRAIMTHDGSSMKLLASGDSTHRNMIFYRDGGDDEAMRINTSNFVGIGTSSPDGKLDIASPQTTSNKFTSPNLALTATVQDNNEGFTGISYASATTTNYGWTVGATRWTGGTGHSHFTFRNHVGSASGNERVRIDTSGNIQIAKTARADNTVGHSLQADGLAVHTRDGNEAMFLNRKSSDGKILSLRKDNSEVGSIASNSGSIELDSQGSSLKFSHLGTNVAFLISSNFAPNADNAMDLGYNSGRFKDLYLGGGLYVGGTGSANKLDDYEEGTWTPVLNSGTYTLIFAKYTKIGNVCYLSFRMTNFSDSSSATNIQITGMPFTQPSNTEEGVGLAYGERTDVNKPTVCMNSNIIFFRDGFGVSTFSTPLQYSDINNGADFDVIANVTYQTS